MQCKVRGQGKGKSPAVKSKRYTAVLNYIRIKKAGRGVLVGLISPLETVSWECLLEETIKDKRNVWIEVDSEVLIVQESTNSGLEKSMISVSAKILGWAELKASQFSEHPGD